MLQPGDISYYVRSSIVYSAIWVAVSALSFAAMFLFDGKFGGVTAALMTLGASGAYGLIVSIIGADVKRIISYIIVCLPIFMLAGLGYWTFGTRI